VTDALLTIGDFARRTGLTERALRLYGDRGLLEPREIDPQTGYRRYDEDQIDDGRLVAMLRAIEMPLAEIEAVLDAAPEDRSAAVGRYWYRFERELDRRRRAVSAVRTHTEEEDAGMTRADRALERAEAEGAFAAIAELALIDDAVESAEAHREAMKTAYWQQKDLALTVALAYAGTSRMLSMATHLESDAAYAARSEAKAMMYDLASFSWPGWDEPGIEIAPTDAAAGLAAARSNLAMAIDLEKPDLAVSRAHWMLGAHLMTAGENAEAGEHFERAAVFASKAGADVEVDLSRAFGSLAALAGGAGSEADLEAALDVLSEHEHGPDFADQVTTARRVVGV
jgi:DNA-binding transcriptional MerR regulator